MGIETATVRVDPSGQVTVRSAPASHGQGIETTMAQVVAEDLGVDIDDVMVVQGDTAVDAVRARHRWQPDRGDRRELRAATRARSVRAKAIEIAAHLLEAAPDDLEIVDARSRSRARPRRSVAWPRSPASRTSRPARLPDGMDAGLEATVTFKAPPITWSNACHVVHGRGRPRTPASCRSCATS